MGDTWLLLNLVIWMVFAYRFLRALMRRKVTGGESLYIWGIIFLLYLVAALKTSTFEADIDELFGDLPATTLIRSLLILTTAQLYSVIIFRTAYAPSERVQRAFRRFNPLVMLACAVVFVLFVPTRLISPAAGEHVVKSMRDAMMIAWAVLVYVPVAVKLWRTERLRPAKLFDGLNVVFYAIYVLNCIGELVWALVYSFAPQWESALTSRLNYLDYLVILCLLLMLFPFRRLLLLFYPGRLWTYLRLRRLERFVLATSPVQPYVSKLHVNLARIDDLELAIYQTAIAILDCYPAMNEHGYPVRDRIAQTVEQSPQYEQLVQGMAAIRP